MAITQRERQVLRQLGEKYMRTATLPVQNEKVLLWKSLNRSRMQRPMVCIDQLPWYELIVDEALTCQVADPYWKGVEWDLRSKLYRWNHFAVDMVLEPYITIPRCIESSGYGLSPQVERLELSEGTTAASQQFTAVLSDYEDIEKITDLSFTVDNGQNELRLEQARDIWEGVAPFVLGHGITMHLGVWDFLTQMMSIGNAFIDIMDRPEFIHACMERMTRSTIAGIEQLNALGIYDDIANMCHCSYIYTDELLPGHGQGKGPFTQNSWAFGLAQLFTSVSPKVTEEFELPYITRMAKYFGMIYYGCCDRLDDRLDVVKRIPNVKKVSCSPWSDRKRFAENIGGKLIMSNKPTPAYLAPISVNWGVVRDDLQRTVDLARENQVNLELILKDVSTVHREPQRLTKWAQIAMEVVQG